MRNAKGAFMYDGTVTNKIPWFNYDCCKIIKDTIMTHITQNYQFGLKRCCKSIP